MFNYKSFGSRVFQILSPLKFSQSLPEDGSSGSLAQVMLSGSLQMSQPMVTETALVATVLPATSVTTQRYSFAARAVLTAKENVSVL